MQITNRFRAFLGNNAVTAVFKLSAAWLPGLMIGAYVGCAASTEFAPYLYSACGSRASFLGSVFILLIPLLLTLVLERCFCSALILPVIFLKAFSFSAIATACAISYESAGWLVCRFLLFSDFFGVLVLLWLWLRILQNRLLLKRDLLVASFGILTIGTIDYLFVSPFLVSMFHF